MKKFNTLNYLTEILKYGSFYHLLISMILIFKPLFLFNLFSLGPINFPIAAQLYGLFFGLFGLGFFIASFSIEENWLFILIGFLEKIFELIIFISYIKNISFQWLSLLFINNILWILLLLSILNECYKFFTIEDDNPLPLDKLLKYTKVNSGKYLTEISHQGPVLLIFIRHFGCTFCRETVSDVKKLDREIKMKGLTPVFVHMSDPDFGEQFFEKYYKEAIYHVSDPNRSLYKSLKMKRGTILQVFGLKSWFRFLYAGLLKGHGLGQLEGDGLQLGGIFVLKKDQIVYSHLMKSVHEQFDLSLLPNFNL
jgi:hypothetical protein